MVYHSKPIEVRVTKLSRDLAERRGDTHRLKLVWGLDDVATVYVKDWKAYLTHHDWHKVPRVWD